MCVCVCVCVCGMSVYSLSVCVCVCVCTVCVMVQKVYTVYVSSNNTTYMYIHYMGTCTLAHWCHCVIHSTQILEMKCMYSVVCCEVVSLICVIHEYCPWSSCCAIWNFTTPEAFVLAVGVSIAASLTCTL